MVHCLEEAFGVGVEIYDQSPVVVGGREVADVVEDCDLTDV